MGGDRTRSTPDVKERIMPNCNYEVLLTGDREERNMNENDIMVSVVCTVYNHEKYVGQALESFVKQKTDFKFEVIVHDDASTDSSAQIISQYAEKYPDIVNPIYQQENQYSQGKRIFDNFILPRVKGKYIAFCEGDDFWSDENKLQIQVDFLENHKEYSACVHNTECWNFFTNRKHLLYEYNADIDISVEQTIKGMRWHTSSLMYKKEYGGNRPAFFEKAKTFGDYPLSIYLALNGKVWYIDRVMSVYRGGVDGSWSRRNYFKLEKSRQICENTKEMFQVLNEYTNYQYKDLIDRRIAEEEYNIEEFSEHYSALRKEPYRRIYCSKPLSYKVKIFIRQYFNGAYHLWRRYHYSDKRLDKIAVRNR